MNAPGYDSYRESGVEWLDRVPSHWTVKPLKRAFSVVTERTPRRSWALGLENIEGWSGRLLETETEFEGEGVAFETSDILYGKLRPYLAKVHVAERPGEAVGDFHVLRAHQADVVSRYIAYQLLTREMVSQLNGSTFGARMPRVGWDFMGSVAFAFPPPAEQAVIAAFLDRETSKIDALVEAQTRLIELLKEKRQAVISHAVTKGLDPAAPMKDSGFEWLGQVPEKWEVRSLGSIANVVRGASPRPAGDPRFFAESGLPWVTVAEITKDDEIALTATSSFLTDEGAQSSRTFEPDTLLYSNSGATLGVPKILAMRACANDGVVGFLNPASNISLPFLYYFLTATTEDIRNMVKQGSGQPNLNTDIVRAIKFAAPPLAEQREIEGYLTKILADFKDLTTAAESAISLLQERRAALISAAVTGKIDVRGLAPAQAEAA